MPKWNWLLHPAAEAPRDIPGCHGVSPRMMSLSSTIEAATREGTLGVPYVPPLENAHFGVEVHLCGPFSACTVRYDVLKAIQSPQKTTSVGQDIILSGWALCPRARSCSTCHHGTPMAARVTLTLQLGTHRCPHSSCYHVIVWPMSPMLEVQGWTSKLSPSLCQHPQFIPARDVAGARGCHQPGPGARGVSGPGGRAGSWAGDHVLLGSEELCTSGFLTLAFNIPPQPDGKNK